MNLLKMAEEKKVLLAAHMGSFGGNIPPNSLQAFQMALYNGADIIELDVESSLDGELFVQHPHKEEIHLRLRDRIRQYPASVVEQLRLSNYSLNRTEWCIPRLEDALRMLKGKCIINIDKFWGFPKEISEMIRKLGMEDQILVKSLNKPERLDMVEKYAPDLYYMNIVKDEDTTYEEIKSRNINFVGTEVLFDREDAAVAGKDYIDMLHKDGKIVWVNALVYNYETVLSAYHNDDVSVLGEPEKGWGWLADRGFDIIQTDFIYNCRLFLENTGRRNK